MVILSMDPARVTSADLAQDDAELQSELTDYYDKKMSQIHLDLNSFLKKNVKYNIMEKIDKYVYAINEEWKKRFEFQLREIIDGFKSKHLAFEKRLEIGKNNEQELISENENLQKKIGQLELEKVSAELRALELEQMFKNDYEAAYDAYELKEAKKESKENIVKGNDAGVQTETFAVVHTQLNDQFTQTDFIETEDFSLPTVSEVDEKLNEAYNVIMKQERRIGTLLTKIKDWGLEDKLQEQSRPRRQVKQESVDGYSRPERQVKQESIDDSNSSSNKFSEKASKTPSKANTNRKTSSRAPHKTPSKANTNRKTSSRSKSSSKKKIYPEESDSSDENVSEYDIKHPTSSFNLRLKGRNSKGRMKLVPFSPLLHYTEEKVPSVICELGENTQGSMPDMYFALRRSRKRKIDDVVENQIESRYQRSYLRRRQSS